MILYCMCSASPSSSGINNKNDHEHGRRRTNIKTTANVASSIDAISFIVEICFGISCGMVRKQVRALVCVCVFNHVPLFFASTVRFTSC